MRVDEGAGPPASIADMVTPGEGRSGFILPRAWDRQSGQRGPEPGNSVLLEEVGSLARASQKRLPGQHGNLPARRPWQESSPL